MTTHDFVDDLDDIQAAVREDVFFFLGHAASFLSDVSSDDEEEWSLEDG